MSSIAHSAQADPRTVLITGGVPHRAAAVASALRETGARPVVIRDLPAGVGIGGMSFDAYLQLPIIGTGTARRGEQDSAQALYGRLRAATTALPWLSPAARVVLVSAPLAETDTQLDTAAGRALMRLIGQALRSGHTSPGLSVEICDHGCTPQELAAATHGPPARPNAQRQPADDSPAAYANWRTEMLGLIRPVLTG